MSMIIADRYTVLELIGKGGMADVYLALDTLLDREVAIKLLKSEMNGDSTSIERFKREAEAIAKLAHPNIVDIYDVGEDNGNYYIVMEYVKGATLKNLIKKRGAIEPKEAVFLMKQLCSAIKAAHDKGVIHRDIKSQNIIIKDDGTLKVLDFGIALANDAIQITSDDIVLGSVHYLAPELSKGESATELSDIYAMGIILYELLTGDVPFKGDQAIQIAIEHVKNKVPSTRDFNPSIPVSVDNIVTRATAKVPANRYQSAEEMLFDLKCCFEAEHANDKPLVIKEKKNLNSQIESEETDDTATIKRKRIRRRGTNFLLAIIVCIVTFLLAALIFFILYMSGFFKPKVQYVQVPDITYSTIQEAESELEEYSIYIDKTRITRELTADTQKGLIIRCEPEVGTEVEKGSKVQVVVSDGIYAVMKDYIGKDINETKEDIKYLFDHVTVSVEMVEDEEKEPGTIIEQTGLTPGETFDTNISTSVKFKYVAYTQIQIPPSIIGQDIGVAMKYFEDMGVAVEISRLDTDDLTEDELADIEMNTVIKTEPSIGNTYTQNEGTTLILYAY